MTLKSLYTGRQAEWVFVLLCLLFVAWHSAVTIDWLTFPYANEYREWAQAEAALRIWDADGPYAGPQGNGIYLYGFLYPLLGSAVHGVFAGNILLEMRLLSYAFVWASAALAAWTVYEESRRLWAATLGFVWLLTAVGWQNVPGVAAPAPVGTFILLLALRAARQGSVVPAVLTVLLFYVKPYFLALYLPLQLYYCLRNRRAAFTYFFTFAFVGVVSLFAVRAVWPYYFLYNVVHHATAASASMPHLLRQLTWSAIYFLPLLWFFLGSLRTHWRDAYTLAAACLFLVWLRLGLHTGAFMSYVFHLWMPPLAVAALSRAGTLRRPYVHALSTMLLLCVAASKHLLPSAPDEALRAEWDVAAKQVARCDAGGTVCLSPMMASVSAAAGQRVLDNGQAQYVCSLYNPSSLLRLLFPEEETMRSQAENFERALLDDLTHGSYTCVIADDHSLYNDTQLRMAGYRPYGSWMLRAGLHEDMVTIWKR